MKFSGTWIIENIFMLIMFILFLFLVISLPKEVIDKFKEIALLYYMFIAVDILFLLCFLVNIFSGSTYYKYIFLSSDKFEIKEYENETIIVYNNWSHSFKNKKSEIAKLKQIKIKEFYNIRKTFLTWQFAIYEQV